MYNIFNILSLLCKHNTFLFVYCILLNNGYLGIYLKKNNKTTNQTKQAKNGKKRKKEDKKRMVQSRTWTQEPSAVRDFTLPLHHEGWLHLFGENSLI